MFGCQVEVSVWAEAREWEERAGTGAAVRTQLTRARSDHAPPPPTRPRAPLSTLVWQEAVVRGEPSHPSFQDLCDQGDGAGGGVEVG